MPIPSKYQARMGAGQMSYFRQKIILTTKHDKEKAIAPVFKEALDCEVIHLNLDTDQLGTFSGEIEREFSPLECARKKCLWGLEVSGESIGMATEATFGPHPAIELLPFHHELIYFYDKDSNFELCTDIMTSDTNFRSAKIERFETLQEFSKLTHFPSHGLILKSIGCEKPLIIKGIQDCKTLEQAFEECLKKSKHRLVLVQTDMRAHMNPTRMKMITEVATKLTKLLQTYCPNCRNPGWSIKEQVYGLECMNCLAPTPLVKHQISRCDFCCYQITDQNKDLFSNANPEFCSFCNP
jgi:hypothetical protein